jgi:hypothetical protein
LNMPRRNGAPWPRAASRSSMRLKNSPTDWSAPAAAPAPAARRRGRAPGSSRCRP